MFVESHRVEVVLLFHVKDPLFLSLLEPIQLYSKVAVFLGLSFRYYIAVKTEILPLLLRSLEQKTLLRK
jgi:hypothetical protein